MDLGIQGKRALVCAGSKGLGKAIAKSLAMEGVELFLCARGEEDLIETVKELHPLTDAPIHHLSCDLSDPVHRGKLIDAVNKVFPSVDILIHNTGGPTPTTVEETSLGAWEEGFHRLFMSVAHLNEAFLPKMKENHWGRIVTVTSIAVVEPIPNLAVSNGLRAAVTGMLKTLSTEVAPYGVTVNCAAPGIIHTDRTEERIRAKMQKTGQTREDCLKEYVGEIPMGRTGTPEEYAGAVSFLCSQQASYITGVTLCIDGGRRKATY